MIRSRDGIIHVASTSFVKLIVDFSGVYSNDVAFLMNWRNGKYLSIRIEVSLKY